jgi:putative redox protein
MSDTSDVKRSLTVWQSGAHFVHHVGEVSYATDANLEGAPGFLPAGPSPMESLLGALAACSGVDLVSILRKMKLAIRELRIEVAAERAPEHPRVYTRIHLDYHIATDPVALRKVQRALGLSADKYCSVSAMLAASAVITYSLHYDGQRYEGAFHGTHDAG